MAKKPAKKAAKKTKNGKSKKHLRLILIGLILLSVAFFSTAILFYIGLIPAFVAFFVDRTPGKMRALTVGAFNIMGCMPFALELWSVDDSLSTSLSIIMNPVSLVLIYLAAALGYVVDWGFTAMASIFLYKKGLLRQEAIKKRQKKIVERWGSEVADRR